MNYYVYTLLDPRKDNEPFYVGKGHGNRAEHHINGQDLHNKFKVSVIEKIRESNLEPIIVFESENMTEEAALDFEIGLIKKYGRRDIGTGCLTNLTDGGEGVSGYIWTEEQIENRLKSWDKLSTREKISKSNSGKKRSLETRQKLSNSHKGKKQTIESNQKRSDKLKGRRLSEEQKQKIRESKIGKKNPMFGKESPMKNKFHSEESKSKIREARKLQSISDETRKKMSEAQKLRHKKIKDENEESKN